MVASRTIALCATLAAVVCAYAALVAGQEVADHSFRPPFQDFDANFGNRRLPRWMIGGSAVLNENFLRLTPDRASKRGYAWHTDAMNMEHFTVSTYFRVSGQGSSLFGDGFAVWLTTSNRYREGPLHGFSETFTGIGIVFDTFRNLESGHVHKDVAVIVNDGSGPYKLDDGVEPQGCDGDFRYHEGRDDFNVHARSGAAITLNKDVLTIRLDSKGDGNWKECVQSYKIPIQGEWYRQLYLGVTASTGQLADNHDIIAMITAEGNAIASEKSDVVLPEVSTGSPQVDAAIKTALAKENALIKEKLQHMHHHVEHQVESIRDSIKHTIKKMQEQEKDNLRRIEALEKIMDDKVATSVDGKIQDRIARLESSLSDRMDERVQKKLPELSKHISDQVGSGGAGWVIPFVMLLLGFLGFAAWAMNKYKSFQKQHLI